MIDNLYTKSISWGWIKECFGVLLWLSNIIYRGTAYVGQEIFSLNLTTARLVYPFFGSYCLLSYLRMLQIVNEQLNARMSWFA